jgi:OpgC protein
LKSPVFWPAIICGQHSLEKFCLGVFLSFAGHFVFTEVSDRLYAQILVSALGIAIMVGVAALVSWYKRVEKRGPGPRPPATQPGYAGGGA